MWGLIVELGIVAGEFIYHRWIEHHPKPLPGQMNMPRVDDGAPIPLLYGTCRVRAPVLAWSGNFVAIDLHDIGLGTGDGFQYRIDMFYLLGIPFNGGQATRAGVFTIFAGDAQLFVNVVNPSPDDPDTRYQNPDALWSILHLTNTMGGQGNGGGFSGNIELWPGTIGQSLVIGGDGQGSFSETEFNRGGIASTDIPSYRQVVACMLWDWNFGEAPNLTGYNFAIKSMSAGSSSDMGHELEFDADPAAVIYDLLTSPWGKAGIPTSEVDLPSFQAASLTLFNEGHGYSRSIEAPDDAINIINDVLKQIDGLIYEEPTTGKLVLRLIRQDFNLAVVDDINPDNAEPAGSGWYQVSGWSELTNQVRVTFTDGAVSYNDGVAIAQNQACVVTQQDRLRSVDLHFPGCRTKELGQKLASRELAVLSRPNVKASMIVSRSFYQKRAGDVVTLTWPELGIVKMVMRIVQADLGQLHAGKIRLDMMRDVSDVTVGAFAPP